MECQVDTRAVNNKTNKQADLYRRDARLDCEDRSRFEAAQFPNCDLQRANGAAHAVSLKSITGCSSSVRGPLFDGLRSGVWLTVERARGYSLVLLALFILAIGSFVALSDGLNDFMGRPIGTDFSNVYTAGVLVREGRVSDPYDPIKQHAAEKKLFGAETPFYGWHYPPFFLLIAAVLATLPYAWALATWLLLTFSAYLIALYSIRPRGDTLLVASAFPAALVNIGHGQNAFLTAALLGGALVLLNPRPVLAGVLIGLLAYKPQFGVLIPFVLLATGRWTAILAAAATISGLAAISWLALGGEAFEDFAASTVFSRTVLLEAGAIGWEKIQSIFSAFRNFGASNGLAYAAQGVLMFVVATSLVVLWRSAADYELKAAALAIACTLATPYLMDYDLVVVAVAIGFFARHALAKGFLDYELSLLAFAFAAPLITRVLMGATGLPVGLIANVALYVVIIRRAVLDLKEGGSAHLHGTAWAGRTRFPVC